MMQRLLPASLFGRIALVLFIGLLLTQVGSTLISTRERNHLLRESAQQRELVRMEAVVILMDLLSPSERARKLSALSRQRLTLKLVAQPPATGGTERFEMAVQLTALLGPGPVQAWSSSVQGMLHFAV